jgi:hypothetical protein
MLGRRIARAFLVVVTAGLLLAATQLPTLAADADGPGTSGPFGSVTCGQSGLPSCVITAGSAPRAGATPPRGGGTTGNVAPAGCAGTVDPNFGCIPPGCQVTVQTLFCPLGAAGPGVPAPPTLGVLAARARALLVLPAPVIQSSPAPGQLQLTRLPTWLWVSKAIWAPQSRTAAVPGESVTATAAPASVSWDMGNGATVTCGGPGIPYTSKDSPASASPDCGYTYTRSSAGQPGGAYRATATITWDITWTGPGGAGGALAPLFTTAIADFQVAQAQAVNVASGG